MRLEESAVRADHLGLDPDPEAEPQRLDPGGDAGEAVRELARVDEPVAERRRVVVARTEPSVIEDEQLDAKIARRLGDPQQLRLVEVEIGRLPVVDEDRPRGVAPGATGEPVAVEPVEGVAHRAEAHVGVDDHGLRGRERLARLELPLERIRADADPDPGRVEWVHFRLGDEVPRIDEAEPVDLAGGLGRRHPLEGDERVVLGAGRAAVAADRLTAGSQSARRDVGLARPCSRKLDELPASVREVEGGAHGCAEPNGCRTIVADPRTTGYHRQVAEDRVREIDCDPACCIDKRDLERVGLVVIFDIRDREVPAAERDDRLAGEDPVTRVDEGEEPRTIRECDFERGYAVVAGASSGVFERDRITDPVREPGKAARDEMGVRTTWGEGRPERQVTQGPVIVDAQDVADPVVAEVELACLRQECDGHVSGWVHATKGPCPAVRAGV